MDKKVQNQTQENEKAKETSNKPSFIVRTYDKAKQGYMKFKTTKVGRIVINVTKLAGIGAVGYGGYKLGRKSVTPATVVITQGQEEEPEIEEETIEEEPEEEITQEFD